MRKMKKILSIILGMVMLISVVNITSFAGEGETGVTFSTDEGVPTEGVLIAHSATASAFVHSATETDLTGFGADDWGLPGVVKLNPATGTRHSALTFLHPADRSSIDSYYDYATQDVRVPESVEFYYTKATNTSSSNSSNEWKKTFMQVIYAISPTIETTLDNGVQYDTTIYGMEFRFLKNADSEYVLASRELTNKVTECVYNDGTANSTTVSGRTSGSTTMTKTEFSLDGESEADPNSTIYTESTIDLTPLMKVRMTYDADLHACFEITGKFTATDAEGNLGEEQEFTVNLSSTTSVADGTKAAFGMYASKVVSDTGLNGAFANPQVTFSEDINFDKVSMEMTDSLALNYTVSVPDSLGDASVSITGPGEDSEFDLTQEYENQDGTYSFAYSGIRAHQLDQNVTVTVSAGGETKTHTYSVLDYCKDFLALEDSEMEGYSAAQIASLRDLAIDLVQYGDALQTYRGEANTSMTGILSDEVINGYNAAWDVAATTSIDSLNSDTYGYIDSANMLTGDTSEDYKWTGVGLTLKEKVNIRATFATESTTGLSVKVYLDGVEKATFTGEDIKQTGDGQYSVYFDKLMAYDYAKKVTFKFFLNDVETGNALNYSVNTYLYNMKDYSLDGTKLQTLLPFINEYGWAAYSYQN